MANGCHSHYVRELLISRNYRQMMQLIEKASPTCVAVGMDTSNKNNIEMADQVEVTKQATGAQGCGEVG